MYPLIQLLSKGTKAGDKTVQSDQTKQNFPHLTIDAFIEEKYMWLV